MENDPHIAVAGAGAIGCFVGGLLAASGKKVTLFVRPRVGSEIRAHGLTLTDFNGLAQQVPAGRLIISEDPACLAQADIALVTVKSGNTSQIGAALADYTKKSCPVVSLQNGTENFDILRGHMPNRDLRAGMVPFNVVPMGQGCFHRATSGDIVIGKGRAPVAEALSVRNLAVTQSADITELQWGKFLVNLANALNALSGLTLQEMLRQRKWRKLMADQWTEALRVLRAHEIEAMSTTPLSVKMVPRVLRLPTPIFTRVADQMLTIDAQARSSMAQDLLARRPTEVDALQGQVMRMGAEVGIPTPINTRVHEIVKLAEIASEGLPNLPVKALRSKD